MDRGIHTLIVRGLMIGMSDTQVRTGLLWWRNSIYKELFDKAITVYLSIPGDESLKRIQKRALKERRDADMKRKKKEGERKIKKKEKKRRKKREKRKEEKRMRGNENERRE